MNQKDSDWPWAMTTIIFFLVAGMLTAMCAGWMPWQQ